MARPLKYDDATEKPVSASFRIPRDLYDQAQHYAAMHRTTLTELVLDGLRWRLETPADPRELVVSQRDTVMQELEQMVDARVSAALEAHGLLALAPVITSLVDTAEAPEAARVQDSNTVIRDEAVQDSNTVMQGEPSSYDSSKYVLGKLCRHRHDYEGTGQSLLYRRNRRCVRCDTESAQARRAEKIAAQASTDVA